jgi:hypothetical protein
MSAIMSIAWFSVPAPGWRLLLIRMLRRVPEPVQC